MDRSLFALGLTLFYLPYPGQHVYPELPCSQLHPLLADGKFDRSPLDACPIPPKLKVILVKATAVNRSERYQDADAMALNLAPTIFLTPVRHHRMIIATPRRRSRLLAGVTAWRLTHHGPADHVTHTAPIAAQVARRAAADPRSGFASRRLGRSRARRPTCE